MAEADLGLFLFELAEVHASVKRIIADCISVLVEVAITKSTLIRFTWMPGRMVRTRRSGSSSNIVLWVISWPVRIVITVDLLWAANLPIRLHPPKGRLVPRKKMHRDQDAAKVYQNCAEWCLEEVHRCTPCV